MKDKFVLGFGVLLGVGFLFSGCNTIMGSSEAVLGFPQPISVEDIIIGSFTYNSRDKYIVRPDGSFILDRTLMQQDDHEAYHMEAFQNDQGKVEQKYVLNDGYRAASDAEVFSWAHRVAAENGRITKIIAVRTLSVTLNKNFGGIGVTSQDITVMVYGDPSSRLTE